MISRRWLWNTLPIEALLRLVKTLYFEILRRSLVLFYTLLISAVFTTLPASATPAEDSERSDLPAQELAETRPQGNSERSATGVASAAAVLSLGARACVRCHEAVSDQWARSSHRHASLSNPYYAASAQAHFNRRGGDGEGSVLFCARCHDPAMIQRERGRADRVSRFEVNPTLRSERDPARAGVGCLLCHSITQRPDARGNGLYTLDLKPMTFRGAAHRQRFAPALLDESDLCISCHKVSLTSEITRHRWLRGQDDADQWSQSAWAGVDPLRPLAEPQPYTPCQGCHMPLTHTSLPDQAADTLGRVRSHEFLGANASVAAWIGADDQVRNTARFVRGALKLWLRTSPRPLGPADELHAAPRLIMKPSAQPRITLDLIALNTGAGHRIPAGVNDTNELWLEVLAWDDTGALVTHSGLLPELAPIPPVITNNWPLDPPITRSERPPRAHLFRAQAVDDHGDPLKRRDVTAQRSVVFDTSLHPFEPRLIRLSLPPHIRRVRARVLMRQFETRYLHFACAQLDMMSEQARCAGQPTLEIARAWWSPQAQDSSSFETAPLVHQLPQWPDALVHLIALSQGESEHVREADELWSALPKSVRLSVRGLISRMTIDVALGRTDAVIRTSRALWSPPYLLTPELYPARHWLEASALLNAFRTQRALSSLKILDTLAPHHRAVKRALAAALGALNQSAGSLRAAQALLNLDSESAEGWRILLLALRALSAPNAEQQDAERRWLTFRFDDERHAALRRSWYRSHQRQTPLLSVIPLYELKATGTGSP